MSEKFIIDEDIRHQALRIMERMDLDIESAINLLFYYIVYFDGWPFINEMLRLDQELIEAINESEEIIRGKTCIK